MSRCVCAGNLIFYDFGMMSEIKLNTKERLADLAYGIYRKDAAGVISALQDLGILVATGDTLSLQRAIGWFLNNISRQVWLLAWLRVMQPGSCSAHEELCAVFCSNACFAGRGCRLITFCLNQAQAPDFPSRACRLSERRPLQRLARICSLWQWTSPSASQQPSPLC